MENLTKYKKSARQSDTSESLYASISEENNLTFISKLILPNVSTHTMVYWLHVANNFWNRATEHGTLKDLEQYCIDVINISNTTFSTEYEALRYTSLLLTDKRLIATAAYYYGTTIQEYFTVKHSTPILAQCITEYRQRMLAHLQRNPDLVLQTPAYLGSMHTFQLWTELHRARQPEARRSMVTSEVLV